MKLAVTLLAASAVAVNAFTVSPVPIVTAPSASTSTSSTSLFSTAEDVNVESGGRQKLYGESIDLPDTYVQCGRCGAAYALQADDLGNRGKGRRVECGVCEHSWYQSRDRLFDLSPGFEFVDFPQMDLDRINRNMEAGRAPDFMGVSKFYVGNLDYGTTEADLYECFKTKGDVGGVSLITDDTGRSRGFAFVTMVTKEDGEKAIELDGTDLGGRNISVRPPNN